MIIRQYDENRAHSDDGPIDDDEGYPYSRCSGPGPDDDFAPEEELPEWLQFAIEAEEEERINELARQHEEEMARKRSGTKSPTPITPPDALKVTV
jgi:hypothetical protein